MTHQTDLARSLAAIILSPQPTAPYVGQGLLEEGNKRRKTESTDANSQSSRSHAVRHQTCGCMLCTLKAAHEASWFLQGSLLGMQVPCAHKVPLMGDRGLLCTHTHTHTHTHTLLA